MLFGRKKKKTASKLPSQQRMRETCLKPGRKVDLIFGTDMERAMIDIRTTTLHQLEDDGSLVLAQTYPVVGPNRIGHLLEITFLARFMDIPGGRWLRAGYKAKIARVEQNYSIGQGRRDNVIIVPGPKELTQFTLRLNFRLAPPKDRDLKVYVWPEKKNQVEVIDLSLGGIRIAHTPLIAWSVGSPLTLVLESEDLRVRIDGRCVRDGTLREKTRGGNSAYTSIKFDEMHPTNQRKLNQMLNEMVRHSLSQRSGVGKK